MGGFSLTLFLTLEMNCGNIINLLLLDFSKRLYWLHLDLLPAARFHFLCPLCLFRMICLWRDWLNHFYHMTCFFLMALRLQLTRLLFHLMAFCLLPAEPPLRDVVATPLLVVSFPPLVMEKAVMALPAEVEVAFVQEVETVDIQTYWEV